MSYWNDRCDVSEMTGHTFTRVYSDGDSVTFENDQVRFVLYHSQDCCENVYVEDIVGELEDLTGWPILSAREDSNVDEPPVSQGEESYTWTFYNFATYKGYVTIRFYGVSNGYYSESVCCRRESLVNQRFTHFTRQNLEKGLMFRLMDNEEFYRKCAELLNTVYDCKPWPWPGVKKTRWNNRHPGSGRFKDIGLIRCYGEVVHINIYSPVSYSGVFDSKTAALA